MNPNSKWRRLATPRVRHWRDLLGIGGILFTLLVFACMVAGSARAASTYVFANSFDGGQASGPSPVGLAVDRSTNPADPSAGDIYVADGTVVNIFTPSAAAANGAPTGQISGFSYVYGLAVDQSTGDLFVADIGSGEIRKFSPTRSGTAVQSGSVDSL